MDVCKVESYVLGHYVFLFSISVSPSSFNTKPVLHIYIITCSTGGYIVNSMSIYTCQYNMMYTNLGLAAQSALIKSCDVHDYTQNNNAD